MCEEEFCLYQEKEICVNYFKEQRKKLNKEQV